MGIDYPKGPQTHHPTPAIVLVLEVTVSLLSRCIHTPCPESRVLVGRQVHGGGIDDVGGGRGVGCAATTAGLSGRRAAVITTTDLIFR